jgi:GMP synthase-like glutamine amidotransferase
MNPMRPTGLVLQAEADAPAALFQLWSARRELPLETIRLDRGERLPDPRDHAFVVALGSKASVLDGHAWIAEEIAWLSAADAAGVPVFGICFGAQALAAALGARVRRLPVPEIGWIEVDTADPDRVPAGPWLTRRHDGFDLPPLAYELASNAFGVQAFCHRGHLGVQFHPEIVAGNQASPGPAVAAAYRLFDGFAARAGIQFRTAA